MFYCSIFPRPTFIDFTVKGKNEARGSKFFSVRAHKEKWVTISTRVIWRGVVY